MPEKKSEKKKAAKRRWKPEEVEFLRAIYAAEPLRRPKPIKDEFQAVFGGDRLSSNQLRYVRLHYIYPDGQADNPLYANRVRGSKKKKDAV